MNLKAKMRLLFKSIFTQFGSAMTDKGIAIIWDGDSLEVGAVLYQEVENENGELEYVAVEAGEYVLEDGRTVVVDEESKVSEIKEKEEEPAEENMEGEGAEPQAAEPTVEEVVTEEPVTEFNPEEAYNELKDLYNALRAEVDSLKDQLAKVLEVPASEDAFSSAKKNEEETQKPFFIKATRK